MRTRFPLLAILVVATLGCAPARLTPAEQLARQTRPDVLELIRGVGSEASLVVVAYPEAWPMASKTLSGLLGELAPAPILALLKEPDMYSGIRSAVKVLGGPDWPEQLATWDRTRPVVAGLFEPVDNSVVQAARTMIPMTFFELLRDGVPGVRSRVLIPATEPARLALTLNLLLNSAGLPAHAQSTGLEELKGGSLHPFSMQDGFVAVIPENAWVRLEFYAGEMRFDRDARQPLARWQEILQQTPEGAELPVTPALLFAAGRADAVMLYARPWQLRKLASQWSAARLMEAMASADPAMKDMLAFRGMAEIALGHLLMTPLGAEMDDLALGLRLTPAGLRLTGVASLTAQGEKIWRAGLQSGKPPLRPIATQSLYAVQIPVNLNELIARATAPPGFGKVKTLREMNEQLQECGPFCVLHFMSRAPLGISRLLAELAPMSLPGQLPTSLAFSLLEMDVSQKDASARMAVGMTFDKGASFRWLHQAVEGLEKVVGKGRLRLETQDQGEQQQVFLGWRTDPREAFDMPAAKARPGQNGLLGELQLNTGLLTRLVQPFAPRAAGLIARLNGLKARSRLTHRALVSQMLIALNQAKPLAYDRLPDFRGLDWESPGMREAESQGAQCREQVTRHMIRVLAGLAHADPVARLDLLHQGLDEAEKYLVGAMQDPGSQVWARTFEEMSALYLAEQYEKAGLFEKQTAVLDRTCNKGYQLACLQLKHSLKRPRIALAAVGEKCLSLELADWLRTWLVFVPAAGPVYVEKRELPLPVGALLPVLLIDRNVPWEKVLATASGLATESAIQNLFVVVQEKKGLIRPIPVRLSGPESKPKPGDVVLELQVGRDGYALRGPGGRMDLASGGGDRLRETLNHWCEENKGELLVFLAPASEIPWQLVAEGLAMLECAGKGCPGQKLVLGPAPADLLERLGDQNQQSGDMTGGLLTGSPIRKAVTMRGGALTKEEIRRVIASHQNEVRSCYETALARKVELKGKLVAKFTVDPKGKVTAVTIEESTVKDGRLETCILRRIKTWPFPKPRGGGVVVVRYPFVFRSVE